MPVHLDLTSRFGIYCRPIFCVTCGTAAHDFFLRFYFIGFTQSAPAAATTVERQENIGGDDPRFANR